MGYVLPWGQMIFWAVNVITNLFSAFSVVGKHILAWLWGGLIHLKTLLNSFFICSWWFNRYYFSKRWFRRSIS